MFSLFHRTQPVDLKFFRREQADHIRRVLKRQTTVDILRVTRPHRTAEALIIDAFLSYY